VRGSLIDDRGEDVAGHPSQRQTRGGAGGYQPRRAAQHARQHIAPLRAERHPDADFAFAAADRVSGDAVDSGDREGKGEDSESRQRDHRGAGGQEGEAEHFAQAAHAVQGQMGIERGDRLVHLLSKRGLGE
jgi:hypothetical protein